MNLSCPSILSFLLSILLGFAVAPAKGAEAIPIEGTARGKALIPISIEGFSDEALNVLKFDLEVAGFKFVALDLAQYNVAGSNNPNLQGRVTDRFNKASLVAKSYLDPSLRRQAHAFADDIVLAITKQKGIAQTKIAFKVDTGKASEIYIADYDGQSSTRYPRRNDRRRPDLGSSRRMLYYTSYKLGNPDIYSHDLASGTRKIVLVIQVEYSAAISPDGTRWQ
jgi:TolB protein